MARGKNTKGHQKITKKKMENESNLQVTFSKRRSGLFKKAIELCILPEAEVGVIFFSPDEKVFTFGHPSVEAITNKFSIGNVDQSNGTQKLIQAQWDANVHEMYVKLGTCKICWKVRKKCREALNEMRAMSRSQRRWEAPLQELNLQQLERVLAAMKELKSDVEKESNRRRLARQNFYGEGGSSGGNVGRSSTIMPFSVGDNYFRYGSMSSLVGPTYVRSGSSNTTSPSLARPSSFGAGEGTTSIDIGPFQFPFEPNAYVIGGSSVRNVGSLQYSIRSRSYGVGGGTFTAQPTAFDGGLGDDGLPIMDRPRSSRDGSSGSQSYARVSKFGGSMTPHGHDRILLIILVKLINKF